MAVKRRRVVKKHKLSDSHKRKKHTRKKCDKKHKELKVTIHHKY